MDYEVVIGLEVHAELSTASKVFCPCKNEFGGAPNSHCCPICTGHPGTLPVLNKKAVEYAVRAGLALGCEISEWSQFARKNYFYPDLPKAYQISQFEFPLCKGGFLDIESGGKFSRVRLNRIHLEEDAGKLVHSEYGSGTLVDYNRGGVPLIEIVTEPDMRSPEEAVEFLNSLKTILKYSGVSECRMERGQLRCDVNLSLRKFGETEYGTRTEMKNVNSFSAAYRAMKYEIKRQSELLSAGKEVEQETRRWDDAAGKSFTMRTKEDAHDYRYFPDPDLLPVVLEKNYIEDIRCTRPDLLADRQKRYVESYGLPDYDARLLTAEKEVSDFFDACAKLIPDKKNLSNWIMGDVMRKLKEEKSEDIEIPLLPDHFARLLELYGGGAISQAAAKEVFEAMWQGEGTPDEVVSARGLKQENDEGKLRELIETIVRENPKPAADYRAGNVKAMAFFVGQAMKATGGKANHKIVNELLTELLGAEGEAK